MPELWELVRSANWKRIPASSDREYGEGEPGETASTYLAEGEAKSPLQGGSCSMCCGLATASAEWPYVLRRDIHRQATVQTSADSIVAETQPRQSRRAESPGCQLHLARRPCCARLRPDMRLRTHEGSDRTR
jgi:hypothetical protein